MASSVGLSTLYLKGLPDQRQVSFSWRLGLRSRPGGPRLKLPHLGSRLEAGPVDQVSALGKLSGSRCSRVYRAGAGFPEPTNAGDAWRWAHRPLKSEIRASSPGNVESELAAPRHIALGSPAASLNPSPPPPPITCKLSACLPLNWSGPYSLLTRMHAKANLCEYNSYFNIYFLSPALDRLEKQSYLLSSYGK